MARHIGIRRLLVGATLLIGTVGAAPAVAASAATPALPDVVVPAPVSETASGATFTLTSAATIATDVADVGNYLAGILRSSTGYPIPVSVGSGGSGTIQLRLAGRPRTPGRRAAGGRRRRSPSTSVSARTGCCWTSRRT